MRVLHTVPHIGRKSAGPSYSVPRLCRALGAGGARSTLMTLDTEPLAPSAGFSHQIFREEGWPGALAPSHTLEQALFAEAASADVIHNHSMWMMANIYPGRVARRTGVPLVMAPRGCLSANALSKSRWKKWVIWHLLHRVSFDHAACFHATADKEFDEIRAFGLRGPVAVIPNGIDIPEQAPPAPSTGPREVLFLGRVHPIKGLPLLLEVWRDLPEPVRAGWVLRIVGPHEDGHGEALQAQIREQAIGGVLFGAPVHGEAKTAAYRAADLYVLPTLTENFGMTVAEALAAGTPVITTRGAPWSGLETHQCGWWVNRDHAALTSALAEAMARPSGALAEMGQRGRAWMAADFGWDALAGRMIAVYEWLSGGKTGPAPDTVRTEP